MSRTVVRWPASPALAALVRRYYAGESVLWPQICAEVATVLREHYTQVGPSHFRFRRVGDGYDVLVEDASAFLRDDT